MPTPPTKCQSRPPLPPAAAAGAERFAAGAALPTRLLAVSSRSLEARDRAALPGGVA